MNASGLSWRDILVFKSSFNFTLKSTVCPQSRNKENPKMIFDKNWCFAIFEDILIYTLNISPFIFTGFQKQKMDINRNYDINKMSENF